jgi:hypothetical protein
MERSLFREVLHIVGLIVLLRIEGLTLPSSPQKADAAHGYPNAVIRDHRCCLCSGVGGSK